MTTVTRIGLEMTSIATVAMAGWLVAVDLTIVPARDPGHVELWALVAIGATALVAASLLAIRRGPALPTWLAAGLAVLALAAVAFGLVVVVSETTSARARAGEGYLFVIGLILTADGALGLAWLTSVLVGRPR